MPPWEKYQQPDYNDPAVSNAAVVDLYGENDNSPAPWEKYKERSFAPIESDADKLRKFGTQDPSYVYGDILPVKMNKETGEHSFAIPEMLRAPIRGVGDLIDIGENRSSEMTPDALSAFGAAIPVGKGISKAVDVAADPLLHPIDTAGKVLSGGAKVIGAAVKPVVKPVIRSILEADNPITGEPGLKTALASDAAKEGSRIGEKLGVDFSAGELTGNPTARGIEDALANSARWGGKFAEQNQKKTNAIIAKFNDTLDKISPASNSRTDVGDRLATAYSDTLDNLIKNRREQAKVDFSSAKGTDQNILSNNLFRELQAIKSEGDAKLLTKSKAHAASLANSLLRRVSSKTQSGNTQADLISLDDMANGLSDFSSEAARPGSIMDNAQSAAERRVYTRLFGALQKDLDAEIANSKGDPNRIAMLAVARDNYRKSSEQIADLQKNTLGKLIGKADHDSEGNLVVSPEKIADRFSAMEPTELRNTLKFLDNNHPDVAQIARRYTLERALKKAQEGRGLRGEGTTKDFAKAEFVKNLPDSDSLNALLGDSSAGVDVKDIAAAVNRMIDYGAERKGSQTAQRTDFLNSIARWGKGALYRSIVDDTLAEDLINPVKRKQIAFEARKLKPEPLKIIITPKDKVAK